MWTRGEGRSSRNTVAYTDACVFVLAAISTALKNYVTEAQKEKNKGGYSNDTRPAKGHNMAIA